MLKKFSVNSLLLFVSLIFVSLLAEGLLRVLASSHERAMTKISWSPSPHPPLPYENRPDSQTDLFFKSVGKIHFSINHFGMRDDAFPRAKPVGESRILMLGDSTTFGSGVEQSQTYTQQLEAMYKGAGQRVQAMNAGVISYNLWDYANWLKIHGLAVHPDRVVVGIFLNDHLAKPGARGSAGQDYRARYAWYQRWLFAALDHSRLLFLMKDAAKHYYWQRHPEQLQAKLLKQMAGDQVTLQVIQDYAARRHYGLSRVAEGIPFDVLLDLGAWDRTASVLQELHQISDREKIPFLFLIMPVEYQLDPRSGDPAPQRKIKALLTAHHFDVIDVLPVFRRAVAEGLKPEVLYPIGGDYIHFGPEGHRLIASEIYKYLR